MTDSELIGELYRELKNAKEAGEAMIALVASLKQGKITLDQIEVTPENKIRVSRAKETTKES